MRESGNWKAVVVLVAMRVLSESRDASAQGLPSDSGRSAFVPGRSIVVSIPDRKLAVIEDGTVRRIFAVSVGAPSSPSPVGHFHIVTRLDRPTYYAPGRIVPPGPANPLGTRWLGLDIAGYGIHGTDQPSSIGHARSHGCIRLRNRDIEELFAMVREGDSVELHAQRTPELAAIFSASLPSPLAPRIVAARPVALPVMAPRATRAASVLSPGA